MTGFRDWATMVFGPEHGDQVADHYAEALGRSLDEAVFYGTTRPIQENQMTETDAARLTEVSATVDAGLSQADLDGMNEAERLALVVGAAYGNALAERDQARAQVAEALGHLEAVLAASPSTSFAHTNAAADAAQEFIQRIKTPEPVDSETTPSQED